MHVTCDVSLATSFHLKITVHQKSNQKNLFAVTKRISTEVMFASALDDAWAALSTHVDYLSNVLRQVELFLFNEHRCIISCSEY